MGSKQQTAMSRKVTTAAFLRLHNLLCTKYWVTRQRCNREKEGREVLEKEERVRRRWKGEKDRERVKGKKGAKNLSIASGQDFLPSPGSVKKRKGNATSIREQSLLFLPLSRERERERLTY